jgi:hypothetical protein
MKTDNVLVSREKWELMAESIRTCKELLLVQDILITMPDFVESDRDTLKLSMTLTKMLSEPSYREASEYAQAAINALKIKGE